MPTKPYNVFRPRNNKLKPAFNIGVMFDKTPRSGDVGLEIEVEGRNLPHEDNTPSPWYYHHDGSLRGVDNGEYILSTPCKFEDVEKNLDILWKAFHKAKSKLDDSNRTSVHVHLNCLKFHLNRLTSFMALYFPLEEILTAWCGEHRQGNLFCLTAKDAPGIITTIRQFVRSDGNSRLHETLHYSGLNVHSLQKFGSVEIRSLRGCTEPDVILTWVNILRRLYELSAEFPDPRAICERFSANGPAQFFDDVLGEYATIVRDGVPMTENQIRDSLFDGIRLAQDLCYCRNWEEFKAIEMKNDPFGRNAKHMAAKIAALAGTQLPIGGNQFAPVGPAQWTQNWDVEEGEEMNEEEFFDEPEDMPDFDLPNNGPLGDIQIIPN